MSDVGAYEHAETAFKVLLTEALKIEPDEDVLLIYDESFERFLDSLVSVTNSIDASFTAVKIPKAQQIHLVNSGDKLSVPEPLKTAMMRSHVILNLLDGDLETAPLRKAIIRVVRRKESRLAHIPGISDDIIAVVARTDYDTILRNCELLAWWLGKGGKAVLTTYDAEGKSYALNLDLGNWVNEPLMSPGIIVPGSWGNFPAGEVFCCPETSSVNGQICIDGSLPNLPFKDRENVILKFEHGQLVEWSSNSKEAKAFFDGQRSAAQARSDRNWGNFCELGFGLNGAIRHLTGNSLFDEKAAQTIHIAIGDNTIFGHNIRSQIHADLVTRNPDFAVEGVALLSKGTIQDDDLRRRRRLWVPPRHSFKPEIRLVLRQAKLSPGGHAIARRLSSGERVGLIDMGDSAVSGALLRLSEIIETANDPTCREICDNHPVISGYQVDDLISMLSFYKCILISDA